MAATVFKIKRSLTGGSATPAPSALAQGELGFSYVSGNLFIGDEAGTGSIVLNAVKSVAGKTGVVTLVAADVTDFATAATANFGTNIALTSINALSDVDTTTVAPASNDVLTWNGTAWAPAVVPSAPVHTVAGRTGDVVITTADLADFATASATQFNTNFAAKTTDGLAQGTTNLYYSSALATTDAVAAIAAAHLDDLSDVVITTPVTGQLLTYNGTDWVNTAAPITGVASVTGTANEITAVTTSGAVVLTLVAPASVGAATFQKVTVDAFGRVSDVAAVATADITALVDGTYVALAGSTMTGDLAMGTHKVTGLGAPTADADAATKAYVDAVAAGLSWKTSVKAASAGPLVLSGEQTVDGIALVTGDRVLVKDQASASANGIYVVAAGAWVRSTDMDSTTPVNEVNGAAVFVEQGTASGGKGFTQIDQVTTIDSDPIVWAVFSSTTAGVGSVAGTTGRITTTGTTSVVVDIDAAYVGQASITTLGTVTTGTWHGTTVDVAHGGTGAVTLTGYVKGNGTTAFTASSTIPGTDVSGDIAGNAANVTGVVAIANGGTGATTNVAGFDALSPMSAVGDLILGAAAGTGTRLSIGTASQVLTSNGTTASWVTPVAGITTFTGLSDTPNDYTTVATPGAAPTALLGTDGTTISYFDTIDGGTF